METERWPDMSDCAAAVFARLTEGTGNKNLGFIACDGDHSDCAPDENGNHAYTCVHCGACI